VAQSPGQLGIEHHDQFLTRRKLDEPFAALRGQQSSRQ